MRAATIERQDDRYTARDEHGEVVWKIDLHIDMRGTPFREEAVWLAASMAIIAGGHYVHFVSDAGLVTTIDLGDDFFGHLGPTDGDVLYVLGWQRVTAIDPTLAVRWVSEEIAVDGIVWVDGDRACIRLSAEMDPPGGWVDVELDPATGGRC